MVRGIIINIFFWFTISLYGTNAWRYEKIGNSDGLSNSAVTSVYLDTKGFVWFGTWDGLNRYDGEKIKVFKPNTFKKGSISNNIIRDIFEDKEKNLWVVTEDGLNLYDYNTESFTSFLTGINSIDYREKRFNAFIDSDSAVWCSIYDYGLMYFDYEKKDFSYVSPPDDYPNMFKKAVGLSFVDGMLWTLSHDGMLYGISLDRKVAKSIDLSAIGVHSFTDNWFLHFRGQEYLFLNSEDGNLIAYGVKSDSIQEYTISDNGLKVTSLCAAVTGDILWGGTDEGVVFMLDGSKKNSVVRIEQPLIEGEKIKIWVVKETEPDLLWIGTDGDGVYKYILINNFFSSISKGDAEKGMISHSIVRSILEDTSGDMWIGTRGNGLNYISSKTKRTVIYNKDNGLSSNAVLSLGEDSNNNIWIGIDDRGIDMYERGTGKILHFPDDFVNDVTPLIGYVYSVVFDSYGDMWLGTSGYGLLKMKVHKEGQGKYRLVEYQQYKSVEGDSTGLQSNIIYSVIEGGPNVMWIGTRGSGLYRMNTLTEEFVAYTSVADNINSLNNNDVLSLWLSHDQLLWVGTSGGLNKMDMSTTPFVFSHITENEGLPNNTIHAVVGDAHGDIWVSTNKGLAKIITDDNSVRAYLKSDGLQNSEYTDGAKCYSKNKGMIYFGGVDGVDMFYPDKIHDALYFPRLAITDFVLLNNADKKHEIVNVDLLDSLVLRYDQNFFKFNFTSLNYHNKEKIKYRFFLKSIEGDFVIDDTGEEAVFTNIPPGKYIFEVQWTNENGIWNKESRRMYINILPPYWQTTAAYVMYVILLILIIIAMSYAVRRRIEEKHKMAIDKVNYEKVKEINQYKFQFFTNIAHEFRTPLTLIMAPAARLMDITDEDTKITPYLKSIYNNSTRLLHLIRELIDFRKVETGKFTLKVKEDNISSFVDIVTGAFEQYAMQRSVELKLMAPEKDIVGWFDYKVLEKVLLNLISNAIKYSYDKGLVIVKMKKEDGMMYISVEDTGKGIPEEYQSKIFNRFFQNNDIVSNDISGADSAGVGLSLTKSLIELHKGTVSVTSIPGQGSCFTVTFPITEKDYTGQEKRVEMVIDQSKIRGRAEEEFCGEDVVFDKVIAQPDNMVDKNKELVMVVDDNKQIRHLIADILYPDYSIITAKNGVEAMKMLKENDVSVVVSDVIMPLMDGLELCSTIKENQATCHIPVIILTAKGENEHRIQGIESGADSYIPKPFDPRHLKMRVKKLIQNRKIIQQAFQHAHISTNNVDVTDLNTLDADIINTLIKYIEENMDNDDLDADVLAKHIGISKTQLYRKVKALTGFTPHGFIKNMRLKKAAQLLQETNLSVSEIIYETGFNNRAYFYRSFKELYGKTPKEIANKG